MTDELETVLRLVAEGRLTPEEASPIVEALGRARDGDAARRVPGDARAPQPDRDLGATGTSARGESAHQLRIRVTERGRQVVNLRIPIGFVDTALHFVPGLGGDQTARIRDAVMAGAVGPILDVEEEDGSGVLITVE